MIAGKWLVDIDTIKCDRYRMMNNKEYIKERALIFLRYAYCYYEITRYTEIENGELEHRFFSH